MKKLKVKHGTTINIDGEDYTLVLSDLIEPDVDF